MCGLRVLQDDTQVYGLCNWVIILSAEMGRGGRSRFWREGISAGTRCFEMSTGHRSRETQEAAAHASLEFGRGHYAGAQTESHWTLEAVREEIGGEKRRGARVSSGRANIKRSRKEPDRANEEE